MAMMIPLWKPGWFWPRWREGNLPLDMFKRFEVSDTFIGFANCPNLFMEIILLIYCTLIVHIISLLGTIITCSNERIDVHVFLSIVASRAGQWRGCLFGPDRVPSRYRGFPPVLRSWLKGKNTDRDDICQTLPQLSWNATISRYKSD